MPADARFAYGKHPNQWADLYLPSSGTKFPVVVTIHGGGWTVGNDAREDVPFAADLVRDGTAVELLPSASKGRPDLGNVITFGASAGGHLAVWAVSRHRIPAKHLTALGGRPKQKLRGAVAYAAPLDLILDSDDFGASTHLMNGTSARYPDRYAAGSPYALLPTGVPSSASTATLIR